MDRVAAPKRMAYRSHRNAHEQHLCLLATWHIGSREVCPCHPVLNMRITVRRVVYTLVTRSVYTLVERTQSLRQALACTSQTDRHSWRHFRTEVNSTEDPGNQVLHNHGLCDLMYRGTSSHGYHNRINTHPHGDTEQRTPFETPLSDRKTDYSASAAHRLPVVLSVESARFSCRIKPGLGKY